LIVRGDVRVRVALERLEGVSASGERLRFNVGGERVEFELGAEQARRWAAAIATPPPALARKLGIATTTRLHVTGAIDDEELRAAVQCAGGVVAALSEANLALVRTDGRAVLAAWTEGAAACSACPPLWVAYVKGRNAPLGESGVRDVLRSFDFIDTKVAAVSQRLTALRFVRRQPP
jgi:hypothetical protein